MSENNEASRKHTFLSGRVSESRVLKSLTHLAGFLSGEPWYSETDSEIIVFLRVQIFDRCRTVCATLEQIANDISCLSNDWSEDDPSLSGLPWLDLASAVSYVAVASEDPIAYADPVFCSILGKNGIRLPLAIVPALTSPRTLSLDGRRMLAQLRCQEPEDRGLVLSESESDRFSQRLSQALNQSNEPDWDLAEQREELCRLLLGLGRLAKAYVESMAEFEILGTAQASNGALGETERRMRLLFMWYTNTYALLEVFALFRRSSPDNWRILDEIV